MSWVRRLFGLNRRRTLVEEAMHDGTSYTVTDPDSGRRWTFRAFRMPSRVDAVDPTQNICIGAHGPGLETWMHMCSDWSVGGPLAVAENQAKNMAKACQAREMCP